MTKTDSDQDYINPKVIRWIALILGSGLSIPMIFAALFVFGSFMSGIIGDAPGATPGVEKVDLEFIRNIIVILTMFLIPLSVLLAWFRVRTGAYLLTLFAFIHIILFYEPEMAWLQIAILPVGPLLLYYLYYKRKYEAQSKA